MGWQSKLRVAGLGLAVAGAAPVWAQGVVTPGQVLDTVRPQPSAELPADQPAPFVVAPAPAPSDLDPNAPRFQVTRFELIGNEALPAAELQEIVAPAVGRSYNLHELQAVLEQLTAHYRDRGFLVARAVLPAQKVEGGVLTIEIIEGEIDAAVFSGQKRYDAPLLGRWGQPLVGQKVHVDALEERLLLINDLPGISARAVLRPGATFGTTTTEIAVSEDPVDGRVSFNNYGRKEVGEHRVDAAIQFNNPFGIGDQLGFSTSQSENQLLSLYGVNYSLPIGVHGTRLAASYTYVEYDVGGEVRALDLSGESHLASVGLSHPLLRSRDENLYASATIRSFSGEQFISGDSLSESEVTLLELGLDWNRIHVDGSVTAAGARVSTNFRDSDEGTRDNAHLFKLDGNLAHLLHLTSRWDLKLETSAMWSPDALADSERFSLGGPASVRGYPSAWSLGDRGVFASIEGRYRFDAAGLPVVFSLFSDAGHVARKFPADGTVKRANLSSVGMGFYFAPTPWLTAELVGAVPTGDMKDADNRHGGRVWFSLTTAF